MADHKFRPEIEVLSAVDVPRRRHWSDTDKIRIVEESFLGHRQVAATARRHGVSRSLLTIWRRQYRAGELGIETPPSFIPLAVSPIAPAAVPATAQEAPRNIRDVQLGVVLRNGRRLLWTYVRDDRPFGGDSPPAALFHFSRDRGMANPNRHLAGWQGILQADAYGGYNDLYRADRDPRPVESALCWSHARRKFFELADIKGNARKGKPAHDISPVALVAVARIDAIFDIERGINGLNVADRQVARHQLSRPLVEELHDWLRTERDRLSKHNPVAKAIDYMFKAERWLAFTRFLDDGRICLTNNAAERALRGIALGRRCWLFAGSERGGDRAAFMYSLIVTAKMNDVDPQAWLADVLVRLPGTTASRVPDLLPWNWSRTPQRMAA